MSQKSNDGSHNTYFLLVLLSLAVTIILVILYVTTNPPTITVNSALSDKLVSLGLACIPNVITALLAFVIIYSLFQIRGIKTSFTDDIDKDELANEMAAKLASRFRQQQLGDADVQRIAQSISASLSTSRQIQLSNAERQKLTKDLAEMVNSQAIEIAFDDTRIEKLVNELGALIRTQYNLEQQAQRFNQASKHFREQTNHIYLTISNFRGELFKRYQSVISQKAVSAQPPFVFSDEDYSLFQNICRFITDGVRAALLEHFKTRGIEIDDDVAVTVKLIIDSPQLIQLSSLPHINEAKVKTREQWVITVFRDSYTYTNYREKREVGGVRIYDIQNNTGFRNIYENGSEYFLHNDLITLLRSGAYLNENPDWQKYYNSTLIVPIEYRDQQTGARLRYGFLTADSKNGKNLPLYNADECLTIIRQAAELLTIFFLLLVITYADQDAT